MKMAFEIGWTMLADQMQGDGCEEPFFVTREGDRFNRDVIAIAAVDPSSGITLEINVAEARLLAEEILDLTA